jgi:hypothetical protein
MGNAARYGSGYSGGLCAMSYCIDVAQCWTQNRTMVVRVGGNVQRGTTRSCKMFDIWESRLRVELPLKCCAQRRASRDKKMDEKRQNHKGNLLK